jgi:hypothetical protein
MVTSELPSGSAATTSTTTAKRSCPPSVKLPREEPKAITPPDGEHVGCVYHLVPAKHRLPLLWLDWSGARVSSIDRLLVGDYDEPRRRGRVPAHITKNGRL